MDEVRKALLKGQPDGNCNREACQTPLAGNEQWRHRSTARIYCRPCAVRINDVTRSSGQGALLDKIEKEISHG